MRDILVSGANIIDGSGGPIFKADVLCKEGLLYIGQPINSDSSTIMIDGQGLYLCPGFIDVHSHGDMTLINDFSALSKISQGITTQLAGQCGYSMFPITTKNCDELLCSLSTFTDKVPIQARDFNSFKKYLKYVLTIPLSLNIGMFVGHVSLRSSIMGYENRMPTDSELYKMKMSLEDSLLSGCYGMSTGLIYPPSSFASEEELVSLCQTLEKHGRIYTTHMRNETNNVDKSVKETIYLAERTGCHVHISHLKMGGKKNWGRASEILSMIDDANNSGLYVTADMYPYDASMTHLSAIIPPKYLSIGYAKFIDSLTNQSIVNQIKYEMNNEIESFENLWICCGKTGKNIYLSYCKKTKDYEGKSLSEISVLLGMDELDSVIQILKENDGEVSAIYHSMNAEDMKKIIKNPYVMIGTDGIVKGYTQKSHPRAFGTFTKAIKLFSIDNNDIPLESLIRKMTGFAADSFKLYKKGYIKNGYDADLVLLDLKKLKDNSSYQNPHLLSNGIESVIIHGEEVFNKGEMLKKDAGKLLCYNKNN